MKRILLLLSFFSLLFAYEVTFHAEKNVITIAQLRGDKELDIRLFSGRTIDLPKGHYTLIVFPEHCKIFENSFVYKTRLWTKIDDQYVIEEATYVIHPETFSFKVQGDTKVDYYVPSSPNMVNREFKYFHEKNNSQADQ